MVARRRVVAIGRVLGKDEPLIVSVKGNLMRRVRKNDTTTPRHVGVTIRRSMAESLVQNRSVPPFASVPLLLPAVRSSTDDSWTEGIHLDVLPHIEGGERVEIVPNVRVAGKDEPLFVFAKDHLMRRVRKNDATTPKHAGVRIRASMPGS
jgi:hypothetical protein